jgi:ubiquinone/menaquinone biosynthesis C-methylase UbiE
MRWLALVCLCACAPTKTEATPALASAASASAPHVVAGRSVEPTRPEHDPPGYYMGRRIAPTMSHLGADWLVRAERETEESTSRMLAALALEPGDVACDLGAGNGYHTLAMARTVAPGGRAIAVDIQPEMLSLLRERAKAANVTNIETILGESADPKLPARTCDLVLLADVYHELDDPAAMLARLKSALSSEGTIALLEFRAEDPDVPIKPEHKMSRAQILRELGANGFKLVRSFDELPWQHLMFFSPR